ncbi:quinone-dependent dihydroorotate dehydrogenase [Fulvimarina sp. 2208YS6-2-32]|uniref:Dihydroorotate dehydrogenase (quinone) n=1 Tax=Fulvimarina uroteuthidis TaxID=3098149 RepID=A0ABU5HYH5_9HYPH|nr:quinone-dependent dihydroorotate dehydrogenase [Fulvimarina sp. 2208YS6-2-32]MDY8107937.1 quinone-dependent dihydroorotate dehydrogenase [Fulvimarina sp. 2208YS6-2-32]
MMALYRLARPAIFRMDPEKAHDLSIAALKRGLVSGGKIPVDDRLRTTVAGLAFPNPLGLAAGYDKNAEVPDRLLKLGFGFVEVGTLTPKPQDGNPKPRLFRLAAQGAVINRFGFNNCGHADAIERLAARRRKPGIVGVNIGANKNAADRVADYVQGVTSFAPLASYLTVNVSSPNTPGLRDLQAANELDRLLDYVIAARNGEAAVSATAKVPVFLKVAPDLTLTQISEISAIALKRKVDGLIVSNTTLSREGVDRFVEAHEKGGLSGRPLLGRSNAVLANFRRALGPNIALIGVGGVFDTASLVQKIEAGADLVQLYTALVYGGPALPARIVRGLLDHVRERGLDSIRPLRDTRVEEFAESHALGA